MLNKRRKKEKEKDEGRKEAGWKGGTLVGRQSGYIFSVLFCVFIVIPILDKLLLAILV